MATIVQVLPERGGPDKVFDYLVPIEISSDIPIGTMVRVPLGKRKINGWVLSKGTKTDYSSKLRSIDSIRGVGPCLEIIELAKWAGWRWAGNRSRFLSLASPAKLIKHLPSSDSAISAQPVAIPFDFRHPKSLVQLPPSHDPFYFIQGVAELARKNKGSALVLVPSKEEAIWLASKLQSFGWRVALMPHEWAKAASGECVVIGTRSAGWAPAPNLCGVVVVDAHEQAYKEQRSPVWNGWQVVAKRAERNKAPCLLLSPCPTLDLLNWSNPTRLTRSEERNGWSLLHLIDRRKDDPRSGLFSSELVGLMRKKIEQKGRVLCVLNRLGRSRLLSCQDCHELIRCELCSGAMKEDNGALVCYLCTHRRPFICSNCSSLQLRSLVLGINKAKEQLEALVGVPVGEITSQDDLSGKELKQLINSHQVFIGTEAIFHKFNAADLIAFIDFDQQILTSRYRSNEEAIAMLAYSSRILKGRQSNARIIVQTRTIDHVVLRAALHADPSLIWDQEWKIRQLLAMPPVREVAHITGARSAEYIVELRKRISNKEDFEILGSSATGWLIKAETVSMLCDLLENVPKSSTGLRIQVDPWSI